MSAAQAAGSAPRAVENPPRGRSRFGVVRRPVVLAVGGYLLMRIVAVAVIWPWARADHRSLPSLLGHEWDAAWYVDIIEHGYNSGLRPPSNMAFFPLFPYSARALTLVSPLGAAAAAVVVAWIAGAVAAWGLYAVGNRLYDQRTGIVLALLWGVLPHAIVESMAYSEGLFTALAVWTLYCVLAEHWLSAGVLCLLAGLSRPNAVALVPVVCLAAVVAIVRRRAGWQAWLAILLAPLGWLGYLLFVGHRVHRLDGWFHIEKTGWGSFFDGGHYTLRSAHMVLVKPVALDLYVVSVVLAFAIMLLVLSALDRQPWPLLVFSALLLALTLGDAGYYYAKARFLIAAFPLLLKPAAALARARTSTAVVVLGFLTAASAYFGGYLLLMWDRSP